MTATAPTARIPSLDGLRAVSIALVLVGHSPGTSPLLAHLRWMGVFAGLGVHVFFVISGYLITTLLLEDARRIDAGRLQRGEALKQFYIRRMYRIFPAAYALILTVAVLSAAGVVTLMPGDLLHAATYTQNFHQPRGWWVGHLWSLSVEEQFYMLWPAVVLFVGRGRAMGVAVAAMIAAPVTRVAIWFLWPGGRVYLGEAFPTIFDAIAVGCILASLRERLDHNATYLRLLGSRAFWLVPVAVVLSAFLDNHPKFDLVIGQAVQNVGIALIIDRSIRFPVSAWGRLLNRRPLVFVGALSYSLYLWQQLFVNHHSSAIVAKFPLNLLCAFVLAYLSYRLVERPFLQLRQLRARRALAAVGPRVAPPGPAVGA